MVKALNKHFSAFGLRVDVIENAASKKILYDTTSADGRFSFAVPPRYTGDTLIFQLYEIDSLENDPPMEWSGVRWNLSMRCSRNGNE